MKENKFGYILIGLGIMLIFNKFFGVFDFVIPIIIGLVITLPYFMSKNKSKSIAFLGIGLFISSMGVHAVLNHFFNAFNGTIFFATVGATVFLIDYIHHHYFGILKTGNKLAKTKKVMFSIATVLFILEFFSFKPVTSILAFAIPLFMIGYGVYLLKGNIKGRHILKR